MAMIFEICVKGKMGNYLEHLKFFAENQYRFMKGKSSDRALFKHIFQITNSIENDKVIMGVYLDLAKVFHIAGIREKLLD